MAAFFPDGPRSGRLTRLTVVLDSRNTPARLAQLALICDHAGIDAVWVSDRLGQLAGETGVEMSAAIALAGQATQSAFIGGTFTLGDEQLAAALTRLATNLGRRLALGLRLPSGDAPSGDPAAALQHLIATCEHRLARLTAGASAPLRLLPPLTLELNEEQPRLSAALCTRFADNALIVAGPRGAPAVARADPRSPQEWRTLLDAACIAGGRDPATLGLAAELPVSIGRTESEARARADVEPLFRETGPPREVGIFGTLEECQDRVIRLAHAGVTDLRCRLPNTPDAHDVIAQVTGMVVGRLDRLTPGAERSKPPDPPDWAGGQSA